MPINAIINKPKLLSEWWKTPVVYIIAQVSFLNPKKADKGQFQPLSPAVVFLKMLL